jgi:hypothetical protein
MKKYFTKFLMYQIIENLEQIVMSSNENNKKMDLFSIVLILTIFEAKLP